MRTIQFRLAVFRHIHFSRSFVCGLLFFVGLIQSSNGQEEFVAGHIINYKGDTTQGYLYYGSPKSNANFCLFKYSQNDDEVLKLKPGDIKAFRFQDSKYYVSRELDQGDVSGKYFLEYLLDGVIEIYFLAHPFRDYFFIEKDGTFIELSDEKRVVRLENGEYVNQYVRPFTGVLNFIMKDAPELSKEIEKISFNHRSIIDLGRKYHDITCTNGESCLVYYRDQRRLYDNGLKFQLGAYVGYSQTKREVLWDQVRKYIYPAISLNVSSKWRTSGQLDLQYHSYEVENGEQILSADFIKILLSMNYEFVDLAKFRPYLRVGASLNRYNYQMEGGTTQTEPNIPDAKTHLNYVGGLGILYDTGGPVIKGEVIYDANGFKAEENFFSRTRSIMGQIGLFLNI